MKWYVVYIHTYTHTLHYIGVEAAISEFFFSFLTYSGSTTTKVILKEMKKKGDKRYSDPKDGCQRVITERAWTYFSHYKSYVEVLSCWYCIWDSWSKDLQHNKLSKHEVAKKPSQRLHWKDLSLSLYYLPFSSDVSWWCLELPASLPRTGWRTASDACSIS